MDVTRCTPPSPIPATAPIPWPLFRNISKSAWWTRPSYRTAPRTSAENDHVVATPEIGPSSKRVS
jgi:hypothetical protein